MLHIKRHDDAAITPYDTSQWLVLHAEYGLLTFVWKGTAPPGEAVTSAIESRFSEYGLRWVGNLPGLTAPGAYGEPVSAGFGVFRFPADNDTAAAVVAAYAGRCRHGFYQAHLACSQYTISHVTIFSVVS